MPKFTTQFKVFVATILIIVALAGLLINQMQLTTVTTRHERMLNDLNVRVAPKLSATPTLVPTASPTATLRRVIKVTVSPTKAQ